MTAKHSVVVMAQQKPKTSRLLLGLPDPALSCVVQHLVASGSYKLKELLRCCKTTRNLVFLHATNIKYSPNRTTRASEQDAFVGDFFNALGHRSGDLALTLDFRKQYDTALSTLLAHGGKGLAACTSLVSIAVLDPGRQAKVACLSHTPA